MEERRGQKFVSIEISFLSPYIDSQIQQWQRNEEGPQSNPHEFVKGQQIELCCYYCYHTHTGQWNQKAEHLNCTASIIESKSEGFPFADTRIEKAVMPLTNRQATATMEGRSINYF